MTLADKVIEIALRDLGLREQPPGSNRHPRFDEAMRWCGLDNDGRPRGYPYCAAMVAIWYRDAAAELGVRNPCPRSASVGKFISRAPKGSIVRAPAPGAVFLHLTDLAKTYGPGHCGLVREVIAGTPGSFTTIEANTGASGDTDPEADRDGDGVRAKVRPVAYANAGFIVFG